MKFDKMINMAAATPINCITKEQEGDTFTLRYEEISGSIWAVFEDGRYTILNSAATLEDAFGMVYDMYATSNAYIYEPEDLIRKKYYFPNQEHIDSVFGAEMPCCLDAAEVNRLANEWGNNAGMPDNVLEQFHEATADEIAEYGVYDS